MDEQCAYSWFTTGRCKNCAIPGFDRCLEHVHKGDLLAEIIALRKAEIIALRMVVTLEKARVDHG